MNEQRDYKQFLIDIHTECKNIRIFTEGLSFEDFTHSLEKKYSITRAFSNIGEAIKHLPDDLIEQYNCVDWDEITTFSNQLKRKYYEIDDKVLWNRLDNRFDNFEDTISKIISKI